MAALFGLGTGVLLPQNVDTYCDPSASDDDHRTGERCVHSLSRTAALMHAHVIAGSSSSSSSDVNTGSSDLLPICMLPMQLL
jgi:hypothetical protein